MQKTYLSFILNGLLWLIISTNAQAANRIVYENFDDQDIDSPLEWDNRDGATYSFVTGHGGVGKAIQPQSVVNGEPDHGMRYISSGKWTSDEIYLRWRMKYSSHSHTGTGIWNDKWVYFYPQVPLPSPHSATDYYKETWISTGGMNYNGARVSAHNLPAPPNDGQWHQYAVYYKFSTGVYRFYMDGQKCAEYVSEKVQDWNMPNQVRIYCPSITAGTTNSYTRHIDDWELWDGLPSSSSSTVTIKNAPPPPGKPYVLN